MMACASPRAAISSQAWVCRSKLLQSLPAVHIDEGSMPSAFSRRSSTTSEAWSISCSEIPLPPGTGMEPSAPALPVRPV